MSNNVNSKSSDINQKENTETTTKENTETTTKENTETTTAEVQQPTKTGMSMPFLGLSILQCVVALFLIVVVLQQSKTASSITSSGVLGGSSDSYWNKNKGRSKEGKLAKMTVILGVIFFIVTITLGFIK